jgi:hypothetical protein
MATSFSVGRSRSTRREPPTMGKQLVNFITLFCNLQSRSRTHAILVIGLVKLRVLLLTGLFIEFDCLRYQCSRERVFFLLKNIRKIEGTLKSVRAICSVRPSEVWLYIYLFHQWVRCTIWYNGKILFKVLFKKNIVLSPIWRGFATGFVNYKKGW